MRDDLECVLRGAVIGAVLGGIGGLLYSRSLGSPRSASGGARRGRGRLDRGRLLRVAWSIIRVVRQIVALD
ncbi:MAG: hypothetical protein E3J25_10520 [Anaerolineales bacterium]|nr:MAG: hypothetical protein E3J25_10520 [Anaerolineales bacterium]